MFNEAFCYHRQALACVARCFVLDMLVVVKLIGSSRWQKHKVYNAEIDKCKAYHTDMTQDCSIEYIVLYVCIFARYYGHLSGMLCKLLISSSFLQKSDIATFAKTIGK